VRVAQPPGRPVRRLFRLWLPEAGAVLRGLISQTSNMVLLDERLQLGDHRLELGEVGA
jgi:hypothetical protein